MRIASLICCVVMMVGCGGDELTLPGPVTVDETERTTDGTTPEDSDLDESMPNRPTGPGAGLERCGLEDFAWLDPSSMGEIRSSEIVYALEREVLAVAQFFLAEETNVNLARRPLDDIELHRIRYTTQDRGEPIDATGVVAFPERSESTELPVVLLLHGTTGATDICAPSLNIEDFENDAFAGAALLAILASYGYVVVAPDYIGMKSSGEPSPELHPYLVAEPTAIASWDAVRAAERVLQAETDGALEAGPVAIWGGSQGGHAAAFTVRFGPYYAPEYSMAAGVYAIPPTDLNPHLVGALSSVRSATANTVLFFASASQWYRVENGTDEVFVPPYNTQVAAALAADCSPDVPSTELNDLFTDRVLGAVGETGFEDFAPWDCMGRENSLTTTSVARRDSVPGLVILAENDTLVETAIERESFDRLCDQGMELHYLECAGARHSEGFTFAIDDALDFIERSLTGGLSAADVCERKPPTVCSNTPAP